MLDFLVRVSWGILGSTSLFFDCQTVHHNSVSRSRHWGFIRLTSCENWTEFVWSDPSMRQKTQLLIISRKLTLDKFLCPLDYFCVRKCIDC